MSEVTLDLPGAPRGEHPATEVLRAYREGRLGADEQEALQEHLVSCDWCAELLLGLAPRAEEGAAVASHETAADWRKLRQRLAGEGALPAGKKAARLPEWVGWAVAAVAILAAVLDGLALRQELRLPDVYSSIHFIAGGTSRSEGKVMIIEAPASGKSVSLQLGLPTNLPAGEYRIQISNPRGRLLWTGSRRLGSERSIDISIPRRLLPNGVFQIRIVGSSREPLAVYAFEVVSR